jgi:hypothetical protein
VLQRKFLNDFRIVMEAVNTVAILPSTALMTNPQSELIVENIHESKLRILDERNSRHALRGIAGSRRTRILVTIAQTRYLSHLSSLRYVIVEPSCTQGTTSGAIKPATPNRHSVDRRPITSSEESAVLGLSPIPDIRGSRDRNEQRELLDPRYRKRSDAKNFFVGGRVFALLWNESAGGNVPELDAEYSTTGRFRESVFSFIRRMAVIRAGDGYCACVPIYTYRGQGVSMSGLSEIERHARAIIHSQCSSQAVQPGRPGGDALIPNIV